MNDARDEFHQPPPRRRVSGERSPKTCAPWCWLEIAALEKIRTRCEDAKSVLLVYLALAETSQEERSENFTVSIHRLAGKCCLSYPTVHKHLNQLEFIGLVEIFRSATNQHMKIPSAYKLLCCESAAKERNKPDSK